MRNVTNLLHMSTNACFLPYGAYLLMICAHRLGVTMVPLKLEMCLLCTDASRDCCGELHTSGGMPIVCII